MGKEYINGVEKGEYQKELRKIEEIKRHKGHDTAMTSFEFRWCYDCNVSYKDYNGNATEYNNRQNQI